MVDIFNQKILCEKCNVQMEKVGFNKNGFSLRGVVCPACRKKIIHPGDLAEYNQFQNLKQKNFKVKLRLVGNSYAVSIPKEIIDFMNEQDNHISDMVKLAFDDLNKLSLMFNE
jgi:hypothetical protein